MEVIKKSSAGLQRLPLEAMLLSQRMIFLNGEITTDSANMILQQLLYLESEDEREPVKLIINSPGGSVSAGLMIYQQIKGMQLPIDVYCTEMAASLPYKTASCVRDTLASALSMFFPEAIRRMMQKKPQFDVRRFCGGKEAVVIITDALETSQNYYANLFYRDTERQLLRYAAECPNGELPREVRYFFDDFACTAPIRGFANDISLFRSAGLSAVMLLQSEQQLEAIYKEEAPVIRQNCAVYAYFPGGFDDRSCEIVSKRMGLPYEEILYAPMGKVFIMQSGQKPVHIYRYDTLESEEYREYLDVSRCGTATSDGAFPAKRPRAKVRVDRLPRV